MMTRYWHSMMLGMVVMTTACNSLKHADAKLQAEQRWNHVRSRVKYQLAEQHYESGLFEDAARTVAESIALDPTEADAYVLLARANLELGKAASAQQTIDAAERTGLSSADLYYTRGVIFEQRHQLEAALAAYTQARQLDPDNVDFLVAQAECLVALNRPAEAFNLLDENAEQFDEDGTVAALTAHIAALMGNVNEASKRYGRALVTLGRSRLIAQELGRLLVQAKAYEEALNVLRPLVQHPSDVPVSGAVLRGIATCHLALSDPASAKNVLADYARAHLDDTLAQLLLAKAAIATNDLLTALRAVDLVQQREPDRPELKLVRAALHWKRGNPAAAEADLQDVLENNPTDVEAHCLLAEVYHAQRQLDDARGHFQRALEIDPNCAWAAAGLRVNSEWRIANGE